MACLLVPATEAVIVTAITKIAETKEKKQKEENGVKEETAADRVQAEEIKIPFTRKLKWLSKLLWGGSILLAFEHIWHGEIVPYFPFLTAMADADETRIMLEEMSTVGVTMALLVSTVWAGMLIVSSVMEKKSAEALEER